MAEPGDLDEIVKRALDYPYAAPERSFVYREGEALELPPGGPDLAGRAPLLAYGANASPEALARKLAALPALELPVLRAKLEGFDVVYSAHVSPYGAVPATLEPSPPTTVPVFVAYPSADQLRLLAATEPNYELTRLEGIRCRLTSGEAFASVDAFLSRHGSLAVSGSPVAVAAIEADGRQFGDMNEPSILEQVRARVAPELELETFIVRCAENGGIAPLSS